MPVSSMPPARSTLSLSIAGLTAALLIGCGGSVESERLTDAGAVDSGTPPFDGMPHPADASEASLDAALDGTVDAPVPPCVVGTQQCVGSGIQTCQADAGWGSVWTCATGTCVDGSCSGVTTTAPSCQGGADGQNNCGASQESCCTSIEVPGGTFFRNYDPPTIDGGIELGSGDAAAAPKDPGTVSGYRLDKYLVTVGRFRAFVAAWNAGWRPPAGSGKHTHLYGGLGLIDDGTSGLHEAGWDPAFTAQVAPTDANLRCDAYITWTPTPGPIERNPMACTTWAEDYAFCIWDGGFLASDAEYSYAGAGGNEQRQFPWGVQEPGTQNEYAIYGCNYPGNGQCTLAPVGSASLGAGRWGHLDLVGNLSSTALDYWTGWPHDPCVDCTHLTPAMYRSVRGGDCTSPEIPYLIVPESQGFMMTQRLTGVGVRCGRAP